MFSFLNFIQEAAVLQTPVLIKSLKMRRNQLFIIKTTEICFK
jgi:hypothetical protein